jgi:hypothetical protein
MPRSHSLTHHRSALLNTCIPSTSDNSSPTAHQALYHKARTSPGSARTNLGRCAWTTEGCARKLLHTLFTGKQTPGVCESYLLAAHGLQQRSARCLQPAQQTLPQRCERHVHQPRDMRTRTSSTCWCAVTLRTALLQTSSLALVYCTWRTHYKRRAHRSGGVKQAKSSR